MKYTPALVCCAALLSNAAFADDRESSMGKSDSFTTLDADSDGKLSKEEVASNSGLAANFDKLDGNSDGYVSKREFRRNTMPKPERD